MDLTDFDPSLLVWGEDVNLAEKAISNASSNLQSHDDLAVDGSDVLALLNVDPSNNTTLMPSLLNNFVSAMADPSMSSVALGQCGEGSFHYPFYGRSSNTINYQHIQNFNTAENTSKSIFPGNFMQQQHQLPIMDLSSQRNIKLPQHLMINHNSSVKDSFSIQASRDGAGRASFQPIFPPNYFLPPGMPPWDPTSTNHNGGDKYVTSSSSFPLSSNTNSTTKDALESLYGSTSTAIGVSILHPQHQFINQTHTQLTTHPNLIVTDPTNNMDHPQINQTSQGDTDVNSNRTGEKIVTHQDRPNRTFQAPNSLLLSSYLDAQRWHNSNGSSSYVTQSNSSIGGCPSRESHSQSKLASATASMNKKKSTSDRNEREQRRAQQITDLIDELRESMVKVGWKVELKGKYHTLSRCVEYLHHLKKMTKEKEDAIERTKSDLALRKQKMDEDKALIENRSEPESVVSQISSLTDDDHPMKTESIKKRWSDNDADNHQHFTKKISSESESHQYGSEDGAISSESGVHINEGRKNVHFSNMCSSISDITDKSIKSSTNESRPSSQISRMETLFVKGGEERDRLTSSSSISSTAAVLSGMGSAEHLSKNVDVSIKHNGNISEHRGRRRTEVSSQRKNFLLDYEEVFRASNIPQLIAALSGRVVACNDFFLHCVGLKNICNMTLFSFVQPEKLADLFELVSKQLRLYSSQTISVVDGHACKHESITLPCIQPTKQFSKEGVSSNTPLYMHVTLLRDSDPGKTCFHCILTDELGTNGEIGCISINMLSRMFCKTTVP